MDSHEEIKSGDEERQRKRRQILKEMIDESFPGSASIPPREPWRVRVEVTIEDAGVSRRDKCAVIFEPMDPPMMDTNIDYRRIFERAIELAKTTIENPPLPERIYQGKVIIMNRGPRFEQREDLGNYR